MKPKYNMTQKDIKGTIKRRSISEDGEKEIIELYEKDKNIKSVCKKMNYYRKPVEAVLLSNHLITQNECKYY